MCAMAKFDAVRMKDLVKVDDPDPDGGITLTFTDNVVVKIRVGPDGKLASDVAS